MIYFFWYKYVYILCNYLSYKQGQWGAEAEGHLIGKTAHFPQHATVIWFRRYGELKRVYTCIGRKGYGRCIINF